MVLSTVCNGLLSHFPPLFAQQHSVGSEEESDREAEKNVHLFAALAVTDSVCSNQQQTLQV